jgi:CheY-like chemotaxis protein
MSLLCRANSQSDESPKNPAFSLSAMDATGEERGRARGKLKVIVVDDEHVIAETLADILNGEGFDSSAASSGAEAIELAKRIRPDVVISDVAMPEINGIETVRQIRAFLPDCRMVLFSGHAATAELLREAQAGGESFELLTKPVKPTTLLSLLGKLRSQQ